ncbi:hypothetical protein BJ165DRAFT_1353039 [Panaeolus papilionaceus]|nr:hypothetical protein BJ165DRAFT_1353039 [Panaeolus papilionaceus]
MTKRNHKQDWSAYKAVNRVARTSFAAGLDQSSNFPEIARPQKAQVGLLVTHQLEEAIAKCRSTVQRISRQCRANNCRFRDIDFDLDTDETQCLYGIFPGANYTPVDVQRVTQLFDKPQFFKEGGADSTGVVQGLLGDCWFLSALSTVSTFPGLIEKICVERDELVGVYGFIFFKNNAWTSVIIDDMLYTRVPKFEELTSQEKYLYLNDKDLYNNTARKHGKTLYFARSGKSGETWVPLIEKAYAKLHGNFQYLMEGHDSEAVEDLTGGVSTVFQSRDILDVDRFWSEELMHVTSDRIFGCSFPSLDSTRSGVTGATVQGLFSNHAYSVLRAVEIDGKRFVICRNLWGQSVWTGRWSDGSKEWTRPWLLRLPELGYEFGSDGQFIMEYSDWLATFSKIDKTRVFDFSWSMLAEFLLVKVPRAPCPSVYGDVIFTFELTSKSQTVIALSQLDKRFFKDLVGNVTWSHGFVLVKKGEDEPLAESPHVSRRGVSMDILLDPGIYFVYVSTAYIDKIETVDNRDLQQLSKLLETRAKCQSIASSKANKEYLTTDLRSLVKRTIEIQLAFDNNQDPHPVTVAEQSKITESTEDTTIDTKQEVKDTNQTDAHQDEPCSDVSVVPNTESDPWTKQSETPKKDTAVDTSEPDTKVPYNDPNTLCLGLRVYTQKGLTVTVKGYLPRST